MIVAEKARKMESCHIDWQKIAQKGLASQQLSTGITRILGIRIMLHKSIIFVDLIMRSAVAEEGVSQPGKFKIGNTNYSLTRK